MKAQLVTARDEHRAPAGSVRSPYFRRTLRLAWPHRRFIILGVLASVAFAVFNAVSVAGLVPILKVLVSDDGLHGWIDRTVADTRLRAELDVYVPPDALRGASTGIGPAMVRKASASSPLRGLGLGPAHLIVSVDGQDVSAQECFRRIADAGRGATLRLGLVPPGEGMAPPATMDVRLSDAPLRWRAGRWVASWIPRETRREDAAWTLAYVLLAVAVSVIISNVFRFLAEYSISLGTFRAMMDLRRALYRKVLRLPMSFFSYNVSDLVSRFVQDVQEIQRGLLALFGRLFREPLRAAALGIVALMMNWRVTLLMFLVAPGAILLFTYVGRKIRKANRRLLRGYGLMIGALEATLHAMSIIKAYTSENAERKRLWRIDRKMFGQQMQIAALDAFLRPMLEVIGIVAILGVTLWLGVKVIHERVKPDEFAGLVLVLGMMFEPLRNIGELYGRVQRSAAGAQRIFAVLDAPGEEEVMEGASSLGPIRESIDFENVRFTYPNANGPAIDGASLTVRRGEIVALVGPNGSGKTTLMNLLLRFYDPQEGRILIDGRDTRQITLRSLRESMSLVTQEAIIFAASMAENIAYGARSAPRDRIELAARRAYADEFIRALPEGYETVCGDRGTTLSGGQRQRLSIARAILRDAPILIFDEATSQIDAESEQKIQTALEGFSSGRTTFVIAHRLSTIRFAHRIVVLDKGRVVDTGKHDELLDRCPLYEILCRTQLVE